MPYYGVKKGRKPGVYESWAECQEQVKGFSGAEYQKFAGKKDAHMFVYGFCSDKPLIRDEFEALAYAQPLTINESNDVIVVDPDKEYVASSKERDPEHKLNPAFTSDFNSAKKEVSLYTDGACSGNPGKGGFGYVIVINDVLVLQSSGAQLSTTNNRMELTAVLEGLYVIPNDYSVVVYTDSAYIVNAFEKDWISGWKRRGWIKSDGAPVANRELWEDLLLKIDQHKSVRFVWVKGHNENKYNEICDRLATKAIRDLG